MRLIDLSHPFSKDIPVYYPWHPKIEIEQTAWYDKQGCCVHKLTVGTHTGTHIDAPSHFFEGATTIDNLDLNLLVSTAQVLNFNHKKSKEAITDSELKSMGLERGLGVIIHTGWYVHHGKPDYYQTYPPISDEAGEYLLSLDVPYLAADTPFTISLHKMFLARGRILITNLANLGELKKSGVRLYAFPLKIAGGDGAPARVLAEEVD